MPGKDFNIPLLLDYYGEILTEKQREVIDLYYNCDLSLAEISEHAGITRQGVRDSIKRGEATMIEMESKLALAGRLIQYEKAFAQMMSLSEELRSYSNIDHIKPLGAMREVMSELQKAIGENHAV